MDLFFLSHDTASLFFHAFFELRILPTLPTMPLNSQLMHVMRETVGIVWRHKAQSEIRSRLQASSKCSSVISFH